MQRQLPVVGSRSFSLFSASLALAFAALGCSTSRDHAGRPAPCPAGLEPASILDLYFGRGGPAPGAAGGAPVLRVDEAAWDGFLRETLLPRLGPSGGSTVTEATGTWLGATRGEPTKVVTLVLRPTEAEERRRGLDEAMALYRRRFDQQAVGIALRPACVAGFFSPEP